MSILKLFAREPDFVIGNPADPYMRRWWITPKRDDRARLYLHNICRDDDDRALHDHPSWSVTLVLRGGYREHLPGGVVKIRRAGSVVFRRAEQPHRLELHQDAAGNTVKAWTLFVFGPNSREWGFHCPQGWKHWRDFIGVPNGSAKGDESGPGCD